ncbi:TonB-dependent receptor plug domain-containing protein, partial [Alistipes communis]
MVEGTVVGREGSQAAVPLVGVAVVVKGSLRNHAVTDLQGRYSIRVPSSTDTLQFTYLGYKPLERVVGSRTRLDVEMLSESQQVDAVVVTALGLTRKEKSLGYAVSTVGSEDLNNTVTNNWLNGMAGKVAGLNFDTSSAGPGGSIRVTLRGEGSLAYDKNEALFVVDGVPINSGMTSNTENGSYGSTVSTIDYGNGASDLNPDDIESVSVLKGPAATALYGSRAANGAIIITTKSGLKSGGLRVTFNSNVTLEQAGFWPDFQEEYGSGVYESAQIDGVTTPPEYSYWNVAADKSDTGQKITRYHARSS